jgi:hypothetical protein
MCAAAASSPNQHLLLLLVLPPPPPSRNKSFQIRQQQVLVKAIKSDCDIHSTQELIQLPTLVANSCRCAA